MNKYLMEKKFCSVYELLFYYGFIELILLGIYSIFDYYFFHLDNFEEYFNNFNYIEIFVIFGFIITQLGLSLSIFFTNKNNTPCHIFIIYVFGNFAFYIDISTNSIVKMICLIFILFMSLIFCEIIELNCFGLSQNTKNNIIERAGSEVLFLEDNEINDTDDESNTEKIQLENTDNSSANE